MIDDLDVMVVGETESTNALALEAAREGMAEGAVFVADCQTAGRGRRESGGARRQWFSPAGKNLYLSVVLRPEVAVERASAITVAVGVELVDLLRDETGLDVELKWPNDLYIGRRKLAGILTEAVTGATGLEAVVVGVGLNVNVEADEFPEELRDRATSLFAESGRTRDRLSMALSVPAAIVRGCRRYAGDGLAPFDDRLQRWDLLRGRRVTVADDNHTKSATACGIGERGGLLVEFDDGARTEVVSGEVTIQNF